MTSEEPAPSAQVGLEAFAALAAHQLGEAIALMRGAGAVLAAQQGALGPGGQDALRALSAGGDRAQRYIDDLLDVVRAGSDPPPEPAATDLDPAFDAAAAELDAALSRIPVDVQREPLPRAAIEANDARRLFVHLLRSALASGATRLGVTGRASGARPSSRCMTMARPRATWPGPSCRSRARAGVVRWSAPASACPS